MPPISGAIVIPITPQPPGASSAHTEPQTPLLKAEALQSAIFSSVHFSKIATDEKGVIQIFNVGAEQMLGYQRQDVTTVSRQPISPTQTS